MLYASVEVVAVDLGAVSPSFPRASGGEADGKLKTSRTSGGLEFKDRRSGVRTPNWGV